MGTGILILMGVTLYVHLTGDKTPGPRDVRFINLLTGLAMAWSLAAIAASEFMWKRMLLKVENPAEANAAVHTAFVIRAALREGAALLGAVACFLAAGNGVLRAYPAYWVTLAPAVLFLFFLWARWPSLENLRAQLRQLD